MTHTTRTVGERLVLTYREDVADPHPVTGTMVFPVTVVAVGDGWFDAQPDYSDAPNEAWSVMASEIERGCLTVEDAVND